jgi:hypothetical protein
LIGAVKGAEQFYQFALPLIDFIGADIFENDEFDAPPLAVRRCELAMDAPVGIRVSFAVGLTVQDRAGA